MTNDTQILGPMEIKDCTAFRVAQKFASTDENRPALSGVRIELDGIIVGVDGHILYKSAPGAVINVKAAVTIKPEKIVPKNITSALVIFEEDYNGPNHLQLYTATGYKCNMPFEIINEDFPGYEHIIPEVREETASIGFSTEVLGKMGTALKGCRDFDYARFAFVGKTRPTIVTFAGRPDDLVLIMPARV